MTTGFDGHGERGLARTLYFIFLYNIMGFLAFIAPQLFGGMAGLPAQVPFLHSGFISCNILLFGLVGLRQARQPRMNAPVLVIFGISKIIFSVLMGMSWQLGEIAAAGFVMSLVDFAMGVVFLLGARSVAQDNQSRPTRSH